MPLYDLPLHSKRLLHVNHAYLSHEPFVRMVQEIVAPLIQQLQIHSDTA